MDAWIRSAEQFEMKLRRLEVEDGFLDGFDLEFTEGLNVLIGARGAGKTSVIELIRYCLGVPAVTEEARQATWQHASSVLADGCVTITAELGGSEFVIKRYASDDQPRSELDTDLGQPLLVSQNEIEAIGLDSNSRRRILDGLADKTTSDVDQSVHAYAKVDDAAQRLEDLIGERDESLDRSQQLARVPEALQAAEAEQTKATGQSEKLEVLQRNVGALSDLIGREKERDLALKRVVEAISAWMQEIKATAAERPDITDAPIDERQSADAALDAAAQHLDTAIRSAAEVHDQLTKQRSAAADALLKKQRQLRDLSKRLEQAKKGAGTLARKVGLLRQQMQEREALDDRAKKLQKAIDGQITVRGAALDELDQIREQRFQRRLTASTTINDEFSGELEIRVKKDGAVGEYSASLGEALQGSGLQYKALSQDLARRMSPRELVEATERGDVKHVAEAGEITIDRAERLVAHLRAHGGREILLASIDDAVDFALLDGQVYKPTADLSMGQRCTVVLPLLMAQQRQLTILDQPEDHLDNAFIVDTLVRAVQQREQGSQLLIATHNANIPVLGHADQVIVMASTGRQGYLDKAAPLDDEPIVQAITSLMEGGMEAFQQRAAFYAEHP